MDIVSIISSVSKIAILAFGITLAVVIYEVVVLLKKNRDKPVVQDHVDIPDFNQDLKAEQHFTQLPNAQVAPVIVEPKGLPKPILLGVGIATIVLLTGAGMWIFTKNKVKSTKTAKEVSPIADAKITPTAGSKALKPTSKAVPTLRTVPTSILTPTGILIPTSANMPTGVLTGIPGKTTLTPTGAIPTPTGISGTGTQATPTPTGTIGSNQQKGGTLVTATPTASALASATATLKPTITLPQAGSFQTSLVLIVVSITLIYLALLL